MTIYAHYTWYTVCALDVAISKIRLNSDQNKSENVVSHEQIYDMQQIERRLYQAHLSDWSVFVQLMMISTTIGLSWVSNYTYQHIFYDATRRYTLNELVLILSASLVDFLN